MGWNDEGDNLSNREVGQIDSVLLPLALNQGGTGASTASEALDNFGFGQTGRAVAAASSSVDAQVAIDAEPADVAISAIIVAGGQIITSGAAASDRASSAIFMAYVPPWPRPTP